MEYTNTHTKYLDNKFKYYPVKYHAFRKDVGHVYFEIESGVQVEFWKALMADGFTQIDKV